MPLITICTVKAMLTIFKTTFSNVFVFALIFSIEINVSMLRMTNGPVFSRFNVKIIFPVFHTNLFNTTILVGKSSLFRMEMCIGSCWKLFGMQHNSLMLYSIPPIHIPECLSHSKRISVCLEKSFPLGNVVREILKVNSPKKEHKNNKSFCEVF